MKNIVLKETSIARSVYSIDREVTTHCNLRIFKKYERNV